MKNIIHWNKPKKMWTSHTYQSCTQSPIILVQGKWEAETKPQKKTNPRGWVVADHSQVVVNPAEEILQRYEKTGKVFFNKEEVAFNVSAGHHLLFDKEGCHLLKERCR